MAGFPGRVVHHPLGHEHGFDQAPDARDILKTEAESPRCCRPCLRKFSVGRIRLGLRSKVQERSLAYHHSRKGDSGVPENAERVAISASTTPGCLHTGATGILSASVSTTATVNPRRQD